MFLALIRFWSPSILPLLAPIAGAAIGAAMSASSAQGASKQARKFAREQRQWDLDVANTAHQREVADLYAAGLNPILSGTGGAGAPSPQAPGAQTFMPDVPDFGGAISSGLAAKRAQEAQDAQIKLLESQTKEADARTDQTKYVTDHLIPNQVQETADRAAGIRETITGQMFDRGVREQQWERGFTAAEWQRAFERGRIDIDDAKQAVLQKMQSLQIGHGAVAESKIKKQILESSEGELAYLLEKLGVSGTTLFSTERNFTGPAGDWIERKWHDWIKED